MHKSKTNGITLIALVITIIVLLILAGVTINAIVSNESAMEKAKQAKSANESANELDTIKLAVTDAMVNGTTGYIIGEHLANALTGIISDSQISVIRENTNGPWQVQGNYGTYRINNNGEVYETTLATISQDSIEFEEGATNTPVTLTVSPIDGVTISSVTWSVPSDNGLVTISETTGNSTTVKVKSWPTKATAVVTATVTSSTGKTQDLSCEVKYKDTTLSTIAVNSESDLRILPNETFILTIEGRGRTGGKIDLTSEAISHVSYELNGNDAESIISVTGPDSETGNITITGLSTGTAGFRVKYYTGYCGGQNVVVKRPLENPIDLGVDVNGSGSTKDDWELLYDGTNSEDTYLNGKLYCILADYLSNERRETLGIQTVLDKKGKYCVYLEYITGTRRRDELCNLLSGSEGKWNALVSDSISSIPGVVVQGGAYNEYVMNKIKAQRPNNDYYVNPTISGSGFLGYWLLQKDGNGVDYLKRMNSSGTIDSAPYNWNHTGLCPVVTIPSDKVTITTGADGVKTVTPKTE